MIKTKRHITYGNDIYKTMENPNDGNKNIEITYWDLWLLILLKEEYKNKFSVLISRIKQIGENSHYVSSNAEAMISHVRLLEKCIVENNISIESLLLSLEVDFFKKQKIKARNKVLNLSFREEEKSKWMIETPSYLQKQQALYGYWNKFPINPEKYSVMMRMSFKKKTGYSESQTLNLIDKLTKKIGKLIKKSSNYEAMAVYRAALSVFLEFIDCIDDSYGKYSMLYGDLFSAYVKLSRTGFLSEEIFLMDLLELIILEDYGSLDEHVATFIESLSDRELSIAEEILIDKSAQLKQLELKYSNAKARSLLKKVQEKSASIKSGCQALII